MVALGGMGGGRVDTWASGSCRNHLHYDSEHVTHVYDTNHHADNGLCSSG